MVIRFERNPPNTHCFLISDFTLSILNIQVLFPSNFLLVWLTNEQWIFLRIVNSVSLLSVYRHLIWSSQIHKCLWDYVEVQLTIDLGKPVPPIFFKSLHGLVLFPGLFQFHMDREIHVAVHFLCPLEDFCWRCS